VVAEVERDVSMTAGEVTAGEAMAREVTADVDVMATDVTAGADVMAAAMMTDVDVDVMAAVVGMMAAVVAVVMTAVVTTVMTATVAAGRSGCGHDDGGSERSSGSERKHCDAIQHGEAPSGLGLIQLPVPYVGEPAPHASLARAQSSLS
jgi:hypothetical protein